jgi:hypothetical protein
VVRFGFIFFPIFFLGSSFPEFVCRMKQTPVNRVLVDEQSIDTLRNRSPSLFQFNEKLLSDPSRLYQFKKFVEQEYADEHLSFYLVSFFFFFFFFFFLVFRSTLVKPAGLSFFEFFVSARTFLNGSKW